VQVYRHLGRWGNDEFMIILDEVGIEIRSQLERLRTSVSRRYHVPGRTGYVNIALTVALGLAEHRAGEDVQAVLERADGDLCRQRSGAQKKTA
jgi:GGDEF domain-containing protein